MLKKGLTLMDVSIATIKAMTITGLMCGPIMSNAQDLSWARAFGTTGDDVAHSIAVGNNGDVITAGYFEGTMDVDPGPDEFILTSNGEIDIYVQKLTSDGEFMWAFNVGGTGSDNAKSISIDPLGNIYVAGAFNATADFDPGTGTTELMSAGTYDIFLAKYLSDGSLLWAKSFGGSEYEEATSMVVAPSGNVYLLSYFSDIIDADPGIDELSITSQGGLDILLQKFTDQGDLIWAQA
ncbi:MAG: SBBP repeat-containing protein, partial [Bacteroidota bacterium]|nr:SBBP repeat-containing protein [Bacteroidota bacterium]